MSLSVRPSASPILMPVLKSSRMRARSRVLSITERSLRTSLGVHRAGKRVGELEPDRFFQGTPGDEILLDEEVEKGNDEGHPGLDRRDVHTAILFVFDEGFEVGTLEILKITLARSSVEAQEEHDRGEGTFECAPLVVQA